MATCSITSYQIQVARYLKENSRSDSETIKNGLSDLTRGFLQQNWQEKDNVENYLRQCVQIFSKSNKLSKVTKGIQSVLGSINSFIPENAQSSPNPTGNKADSIENNQNNIDPSLAEGSIFSRLFGNSNTAKQLLYKRFQTRLFEAATQIKDPKSKKFRRTSSNQEISSNIDNIREEYFNKLKAIIKSELTYYNKDGENQTKALLDEYFKLYNAKYSELIDTTDLGEHYISGKNMRPEEKAALYYYILNNFDVFVSETSKLHGESFIVINNNLDLNNSGIIYKYSLKKRPDSRSSWLSDDEQLHNDLDDLSALQEYLLAKPRWIDGKASDIPLTKSEIFNTIGYIKNISAHNVLGEFASRKAQGTIQTSEEENKQQSEQDVLASGTNNDQNNDPIDNAYNLCIKIYGQQALDALLGEKTLEDLISMMYDFKYIPIIFIYLNSLKDSLELSFNQKAILNSIFQNFFNPENPKSEISLSMNTKDIQNVPFEGLIWISQSISAYYDQYTWDYEYTVEDGYYAVDIQQRVYNIRQYNLKTNLANALQLRSKLRKRAYNTTKTIGKFAVDNEGYISFDTSNKIKIKLYPETAAETTEELSTPLDVQITLSDGSTVHLKEKLVEDETEFELDTEMNVSQATEVLQNLFADYTISETVVEKFLNHDTNDFKNLISGILKAHQLTLQFYVEHPNIDSSEQDAPTASEFRSYIRGGFNEGKAAPRMLSIFRYRIFQADPIWGIATNPFINFSNIRDEIDGVLEQSTNKDLRGAPLPAVQAKCVNSAFDQWLQRFIKSNENAAAHHLEFLKLFRKVVYNRNIKSKDLDVAEYRKNSFSEFLTTSFILDYYADDYLAVMPAVVSDKFRLLKAIFNQDSTVEVPGKGPVQLKDLTQEDFKYLLKKDFGTFHRNVFETIKNKFVTLGTNLIKAESELYKSLGYPKIDILDGFSEFNLAVSGYIADHKDYTMEKVLHELFFDEQQYLISEGQPIKKYIADTDVIIKNEKLWVNPSLLHQLYIYGNETDQITVTGIVRAQNYHISILETYDKFVGRKTDQFVSELFYNNVKLSVQDVNGNNIKGAAFKKARDKNADAGFKDIRGNIAPCIIQEENKEYPTKIGSQYDLRQYSPYNEFYKYCQETSENNSIDLEKVNVRHPRFSIKYFEEQYNSHLEQFNDWRANKRAFKKYLNAQVEQTKSELGLGLESDLGSNFEKYLGQFIEMAVSSRFAVASQTTDEVYKKNLILGAAAEGGIENLTDDQQIAEIEDRIKEKLQDKSDSTKINILFAEISRNYDTISKYVEDNEGEFIEFKDQVKPKTQITVKINPELVKYNLVNHWLGYSFVICSSGADFGNPVVRDIQTDHITDIEAEMSKAATKRNVSMTATLRPFMEGLIGGSSSKYKMLLITDMKNMGFNISGNTSNIKVQDGVTFVDMLTCYEENYALGGDSVGQDKKQFVSSYDPNSGVSEEIKTAGMVVDNNMIKHGIGRPRYSCKRIGEQLFLVDQESKDAPKEISEANAFSEWCAANESVNAMGFMWNLNKIFNNQISWTQAYKMHYKGEKQLSWFNWTKGKGKTTWIEDAVTQRLLPEILYRKNPDGSIIAIEVASIKVNKEGLTTFKYQKVDQTGTINAGRFIECTIIGSKDVSKFKEGEYIINYENPSGRIDSNYQLWLYVFGGFMTMHKDSNNILTDADDKTSMELLYFASKNALVVENSNVKIMSQASHYSILSDSKIDYGPTMGSMKKSASNVNDVSEIMGKLVNGRKAKPRVIWTEVEAANIGIQLDAEHSAIDSTLSLMTQVVNALAARGYSIEQTSECYQALYQLTISSLDHVFDGVTVLNPSKKSDEELKGKFAKIIVDSVINGAKTGQTGLLQELQEGLQLIGDRGEYSQYISMDNPIIFNKIISNIAAAITRSSVKFKFRGGMNVLVPSDGTAQIINGHSAQYYIDGKHTDELYKAVDIANGKLLKPADLIMGHWYKITRNKETELIELNPKNFYSICEYADDENTKIVEAIDHPRDLGVYNNTFIGVDEKEKSQSYNIWQLRSVRRAYTNPDDKVAYKKMVEELRGISKNGYSNATVVSVFENGEWVDKTVTVKKESIQISPFEAILPSSYKHQFRLKEGQDLQEVLDDRNHFIKILLNERINQKISSDYYTVAFGAKNAKTCYLVDGAIKEEIPEGFINISNEIITTTDSTTGVTYRLDAITKEPMYAVPKDVKYQIYRDPLGHEIIKTDSQGILEFSKSLNFSDVQFGNVYSQAVIDGAQNGSVALIAQVLEYQQSAEDSGKSIDDIIKDSNNAENIRPIANLIDLASELNIDVFTSVENNTLAVDIQSALFDLWKKDPGNSIFGRCVNEGILPEDFKEESTVIWEDNNSTEKLKEGIIKKLEGQLVHLNLVKSSIREGRVLYTSFEKSLEYVAARTPSQSHQSFMTMRVVAFNDTERNVAYVSRWQLWLQGSDFDIDKVSLLGYDFNRGKFIIHSPYSNLTSKEGLEATMQMPLPTGFELEKVGKKDIDDSAYHYMTKTIYGDRTVVKDPDGKEFLQYDIKDLASLHEATLTRTVVPVLNEGANYAYKCDIWINSDDVDTFKRNLFIYQLAHNIIDRLNVGDSIQFAATDENTNLALILSINGFEGETQNGVTIYTKREDKLNPTKNNLSSMEDESNSSEDKPGFAEDWELFVSYWQNSTEFDINSLKKNPTPVTLKRLIPLLQAFGKYGKTHLEVTGANGKENSEILNIINTYNTYFQKGSGMYFKQGAIQNFIVHKMAAISADPLNAIQGQSPIDDAVNAIKEIANASIIAAATKSFDRGTVTSLIQQVLLTIGGKDNIKIVATALKVFEAMYTYQCKVLNTGNSLEQANLLVEHNIGGYRIQLCANVAAANPITVVNQDVEKALTEVNQSIDAFLEESGLLSLATDNAKDPSLSKMNGDAEMMPLYTAGVSCGIPIKYLSKVMLTQTGRNISALQKSNIYTGQTGFSNHSQAINYLKSGPTLSPIPDDVKEAFINYIVKQFKLKTPLYDENGNKFNVSNKMLSDLLDQLTPFQKIWTFTELEHAIKGYIVAKNISSENSDEGELNRENLNNEDLQDTSIYETVELKDIEISQPRALLHFIREYQEYLSMCIDRDSDYVFNPEDKHSYKAITILSQLSSVATEMKITSGLILNQGLPNSFDDQLNFVRQFESILQNLRQNVKYKTSLSKYEKLERDLDAEEDVNKKEQLQIEFDRLAPLFEDGGLLDQLTERNRDLFPIPAEEYESEREKDYDIRVNFAAFIEDLDYRDLVLKIADCYTTLTNPLRVIMNNDHYKGDLIATAEVFKRQKLNSILYQTIDYISTNLLRGRYKISDSKTLEKSHKQLQTIIGYEIISQYFRGNKDGFKKVQIKMPGSKTDKLVTLDLGDPKTGHTARLQFKRLVENALPILQQDRNLADNIFIKHLNLGTFDLTVTHTPTIAIRSTIKTNFENSDIIAREKLDKAVEDLHKLTKFPFNDISLYDALFYYTLITYGSESNSQTLLQFFSMDIKNSTKSDVSNPVLDYLKFGNSLNQKDQEAIIGQLVANDPITEKISMQVRDAKTGELIEVTKEVKKDLIKAADKLRYGLAQQASLVQLDSKRGKLPVQYVINSQTGAVEFWRVAEQNSDSNSGNLEFGEFGEFADAPINPMEGSEMEDLLGIMDGGDEFGFGNQTQIQPKYYEQTVEIDKVQDIGNELQEIVQQGEPDEQTTSNNQTSSDDNNTDVGNEAYDRAQGENQGKNCK